MHSSTYPHFFHGSSHRQREYATVTFMNDVMLQPMGERTPMTQSLRDRAQEAAQQLQEQRQQELARQIDERLAQRLERDPAPRSSGPRMG